MKKKKVKISDLYDPCLDQIILQLLQSTIASTNLIFNTHLSDIKYCDSQSEQWQLTGRQKCSQLHPLSMLLCP